jgi:hypothetical protein
MDVKIDENVIGRKGTPDIEKIKPMIFAPGGLPPKKESSYDVRLEPKIKGVNHGQEIDVPPYSVPPKMLEFPRYPN